jgi:hypothetical protein
MSVIHIQCSVHHAVAAYGKVNFDRVQNVYLLLLIDHHIISGKRNIKGATKWKNWANIYPYEISEALNHNQFHAHESKVHEQMHSLTTN